MPERQADLLAFATQQVSTVNDDLDRVHHCEADDRAHHGRAVEELLGRRADADSGEAEQTASAQPEQTCRLAQCNDAEPLALRHEQHDSDHAHRHREPPERPQRLTEEDQ